MVRGGRAEYCGEAHPLSCYNRPGDAAGALHSKIIHRSLHRCRMLSGNGWNLVEGKAGLIFTVAL
jgi:hypothetical protein